MSPIELLKSGIKTGNWSDVCEAYRTLTGETLEPPLHALAAKELASVLRSTLHMSIDQVFDEWAGNSKPQPKAAPKAKAASKIIVPTPDEVEAVLEAEEPGTVDFEPEDGLGIVPETIVDAIKPEDINGDGPREVLKNVGVSAKDTCYNERMRFVSRDADPAEIKANQRKAAAAAQRKQTRPEPQTYEIECTGCGRKFQSPIKPSKYVGQKCGRCIGNMGKPEKD